MTRRRRLYRLLRYLFRLALRQTGRLVRLGVVLARLGLILAWRLARAVRTALAAALAVAGSWPWLQRLGRRLAPLGGPTGQVGVFGGLMVAGLALLAILRPAPFDPEIVANDEAACLALNIYHEARGEPAKGKLAVGYVVMNRVRDGRFPDRICAVVRDGGESPAKGCQFSWWCDGRSDQPDDRTAWEDSQKVASSILDGKASDPTGGALWYHADYVEPSWRKSFVRGPQIGRHQFYRSP